MLIDDICRLFETKGGLHYGEDVTQLQHAVQCAALAERDGYGPHMVAAALLHDIGHLLTGLQEDAAEHGVDDVHEDVGDRWLRRHFPPAVTEPVRLHVAAKRYLCAIEPEYRRKLTEASDRSLMLQGGPMSAEEIAEFEALPFSADAVQLRRYDDEGKDTTLSAVPFARFRPALEAALKP